MSASPSEQTPRFSIKWQSWNTGEWHDYIDMPALLATDAHDQLACFEAYGPALIEIDGGYLCSSDIYPQIRRQHKQVRTFKAIAQQLQPGKMTMQQFLRL